MSVKQTEEIIIFQAPGKLDALLIKYYLKKNRTVWVIEPFLIYKRENGGVYLPQLPAAIKKLIDNDQIGLLKADDINARDIYLASADKAVNIVEAAYPGFRELNRDIIQFVSDTLKSPETENIFKINLCGRLAEFYSINILLNKIASRFEFSSIVVYPNINVHDYSFLQKLLMQSKQDYLHHSNITFPAYRKTVDYFENLKKNIFSMSMIGAQTTGSALLGRRNHHPKSKNRYTYGVTLVSSRQFRPNRRSFDFFIDKKKISSCEVVFFPLMKLTTAMEEKIAQLPSDICYLPQRGRFFSNFREWKALLWLSVKRNLSGNGEEINAASMVFFAYFKWQEVLEKVEFKHFITHSDFGESHVGRNIALHQAGVQTWYFIDSIAYELNYRREEGHGKLFPFWAYLDYDHLVSWHKALCQYFKDHPHSFRKTHVVGCLWGSHVEEKNQARKKIDSAALKNIDNYFVIACFDSTYLMNAHISYAGGIAFAEQLLKLVEENPDVFIIFKEKKSRKDHVFLHPVLGPRLVELYEKMSANSRIKFFDNQGDSSEIISIADMVITFPFSSPTFEAFSVNKPAIWHDALCEYRETLYARIDGVMTHSYDELKNRVLEIKKLQKDTYQNPIPVNSPLMDPYRDGKAIDRFIELLTTNG